MRLDGFADSAFVHAMHVTTVVSAAITLAGALVVLIWMPGRPAADTAVAQAGLPAEAEARDEAPARAGAGVLDRARVEG